MRELPKGFFYELDGSTALTLRGKCVYAWIREKKVLYVGHSEHRLRRVANHNVIGNMEPIEPHDSIVFWSIDNWCEGTDLEERMIKYFRPKYNCATENKLLKGKSNCVRCGSKFEPKRFWQRYCSYECRTTKRNSECEHHPEN